MDPDDLVKKLVEYGLLDLGKFNPRFTERLMREGGGGAVLRTQSTDLTESLKSLSGSLRECIENYAPEKVEAYFLLIEVTRQATLNFYGDAGNVLGNDGRKRFTEGDRIRLIERVGALNPGVYKSGEIGEPLGLSASSVSGVLSHLKHEEREKIRLRYTKNRWEKY